jgi:uncharacterized protein (DUF885 family)
MAFLCQHFTKYLQMKQILLTVLLATLMSCGPKEKPTKLTSPSFKDLMTQYHQDLHVFFPMEATIQGAEGYNDLLPMDVTEGFRRDLKNYFVSLKEKLGSYDPEKMDANDRISYDILNWECDIRLSGLEFPDHYMPVNQFWSLPLTFGQFGSGSGTQPFKTVRDYDNWLHRIDRFVMWCDSAIVSTRTGMEKGYILPKSLILKIIPQFKELVVTDPEKSLYYGPVKNMPADFKPEDQTRLKEDFKKSIMEKLVPAFSKMADFYEKEYLPKGRSSSGYSEIPGGKERYQQLIKYWTTTDMTAEEIFALGEKEVSRIRSEMEKVKTDVGFKGDLNAFFEFMRTDKKFMPFRKPEEVISWYQSLEKVMQPQLKNMFDLVPKSSFEIRRTEAFREASASAEYQQGTADGSRPGIFYVPIPNAANYNVLGGEALFLHEAIPGHHYQISLQQENSLLPDFRKFSWYGAYGEGWALYCESLGKELGLYTDPYQYFGMLSSEMHRAIRLVVDVGLHMKGWTREQAIEYSKSNEAEPEESIIAEIERYMAIPGQALAYKIGQLKIIELRQKAQNELGTKFDFKSFHNQILDAGCLPIKVLENKLNRWIEAQKK